MKTEITYVVFQFLKVGKLNFNAIHPNIHSNYGRCTMLDKVRLVMSFGIAQEAKHFVEKIEHV